MKGTQLIAEAPDTRDLDEVHFGLVHLPDRARRSAAWGEWCIFVIESEDEGDVCVEDLIVVVECYGALRRHGAVFHRRLQERFDALLVELRESKHTQAA